MIDHARTMEQLAVHVDVHHEDGSYWAEVRELPGCFASADTVAELIEGVEEAVALYLAPADADEVPPVAVELAGFDLSLESEQPVQAASGRRRTA